MPGIYRYNRLGCSCIIIRRTGGSRVSGIMARQQNKLIEAFENSWDTVNVTILGFALYALVYPAVIAPVMNDIFPDYWICAYKKMTGNPCPFCGMTTDFSRLMGEGIQVWQPANPLSPWLLVLILLEVPWRFLGLWPGRKWPARSEFIDIDVISHMLAGAAIVSYVVYDLL